MRHMAGTVVALGVMLFGVEAGAQESIQERAKVMPFLYGSIGGFPSGSGGSVTYGGGGGADFLAAGGVGVGGELAVFGNDTFSFAVATAHGSYHFLSDHRAVPFVKAGFGLGGEAGSAVAFLAFGGGVNLWTDGGRAFRIELVDRFPAEGGDHHLNVQLGLTW